MAAYFSSSSSLSMRSTIEEVAGATVVVLVLEEAA
jgi:hypothetical protein